ncbi:MAG: L-aspartate oxidase [Candidatus Latescibacteria bacterium]|nr:L-aspartate oxidase [Candidatus Latescibacterota bacterium]
MTKSDFLVIGSGIAGLSFALKAADYGSVVIITKKTDSESSTNYAQGGIACALGDDDSKEHHIADTLSAGDGLCREDVVTAVVNEGPDMIRQLVEWGCRFTKKENGGFSLGREGGHSRNRIIHTDDLTGREIEGALLERVMEHPNITGLENHIAVDLLTEHNLGVITKPRAVSCFGAYALDEATGKVETYMSGTTILATGGVGQVYLHTTNPGIATGDGIAMAFRAGAKVGNLEFMQFHPTSFLLPDGTSFLISEAVRGYGGVLVSRSGQRLMENHPMKDLAPRDIVARTIDHYLKSSGEDRVYLDVTGFDSDATKKRFPHIYETCLKYNIDITKDPIPVVPSAHYMCGGVVTDLNGRTTISNLYAAGEVALTGLHGANRLASNSLLEAVVMAERAAKMVAEKRQLTSELPDIPDWNERGTFNPEEWVIISHDRNNIRNLMWDLVGIVRSDFRLRRAMNRIELIREEVGKYYRRTKLSHGLIELRNMAICAWLIVKSARHRKESRGLHYNTDYPERDDAVWRHDTFIQNEEILA